MSAITRFFGAERQNTPQRYPTRLVAQTVLSTQLRSGGFLEHRRFKSHRPRPSRFADSGTVKVPDLQRPDGRGTRRATIDLLRSLRRDRTVVEEEFQDNAGATVDPRCRPD